MNRNDKHFRWEDLPFDCLLVIFTHLRTKERLIAAQVCRQWATAFNSPILWRSVTFELTHFLGNSVTKKCAFAEKYGRYLRKLNIYCEIKNFLQNIKNLTVKESLSNFFHILCQQGTQLNELHLKDCDLIFILCVATRKGGRLFCYIYKRFPVLSQFINKYFVNSGYAVFHEMQQRLMESFIPFLESQERLELFDGKYMRTTLEMGCDILRALSVRSASKLKCLLAASLFYFDLLIYKERVFLDVICNFKNLQKLSLNYNCVSEDLLKVLGNACGSRLTHFLIYIIWFEAHSHQINNKQWENFAIKCVNVKIGITTRNVINRNLLPILVSSIPLSSFQFIISRDREESESIWHKKILVNHLARNYSLILETLYIDFCNLVEDNDFEILSLVIHCIRLKKLIIKSMIHLQTIIGICNFWRAGTTELEKLHVHIVNIHSPDEKKEFELLKTEFRALEMNDCLEFHFK